MQEQAFVQQVRIVVQVIDPKGVERTAAAYDAVHGISFFKQQFGEVAAVLAGDAGDEGGFHK